MTAVAPEAVRRASARAGAAPPRPTAASRPPLELARPAARDRRGSYVVALVGLLAAGLTVLLLLHTWAAQDGFHVADLQHQQATLTAEKTSLVEQEQLLEAPAKLAAAAKALGMQPITAPRFVRLRSGRVVARGITPPPAPVTPVRHASPARKAAAAGGARSHPASSHPASNATNRSRGPAHRPARSARAGHQRRSDAGRSARRTPHHRPEAAG